MKAFALVAKARAKTSPFPPGTLSISNTLLHRGGQNAGEFRYFFDRGIIAGCYGSINARLQVAQSAQPADDAPADPWTIAVMSVSLGAPGLVAVVVCGVYWCS